MSVGKYSPTVSTAYFVDQNWWEKNGGGFDNGVDPKSWNDDDGYDEYGYDDNGVDRAGNTEDDYLTSYDDEFDSYPFYNDTYSDWGFDEALHKPVLATYY